MIKKYKKKPVVIEAVLYDGTNFEEIKAFASDHIIKCNDNTLVIDTLEGNMQALIGDYIIKGIKGEFYPCKPDIFFKSYEEEEVNKMTVKELLNHPHFKGEWDASFEHCIEGTFQDGDFVVVYKISEINYRPNGKIETMKLYVGDIYYYSYEDWTPLENKDDGTFQYNGR